MIKGACNCGVISFAANVELRDVFVCHCSICRRATGSNGIAVVVIDNVARQYLELTTPSARLYRPV